MAQPSYLLGFDIGSSSIKASLLDIETGIVAAQATSPKREMEIKAPKQGWAEQDPQLWWEHIKNTAAELRAAGKDLKNVKAIGISYQMHGLVLVDKNNQLLRSAIIWCDSRAVETGAKAFDAIGQDKCLSKLLNSPGNFTASKLAWVKQNEPDIYKKTAKIMLPGDYIAMRMTDRITTTPSGLSEGIFWDYQKKGLSDDIMNYYGVDPSVIPEISETFSIQGQLTNKASEELGVPAGTPVSYRAGDQPNNALSLNVLNPGEIAATAGTSGVVYGVGSKPSFDKASRVNTFVHVNNTAAEPRYGTLLCVNGTGILNSWMRLNICPDLSYAQMNDVADTVPIGSDGVIVLPYGNGAERTLGNRNIGCKVEGLSFTAHNRAHLLRAAQEGIVFALNYGVGIMKEMGIEASRVRAGNANMFLSPIFVKAFACVTDAVVELYDTDGAQGAARGAGIGAGVYKDFKEAFSSLKALKKVEPDLTACRFYNDAYDRWLTALNRALH